MTRKSAYKLYETKQYKALYVQYVHYRNTPQTELVQKGALGRNGAISGWVGWGFLLNSL